MDYYRTNQNGWEALSPSGNASKFNQETGFLGFFADKIAKIGGLGSVRYSIMDEGMSGFASARNETDGDGIFQLGVRFFEPLKVPALLEEFELEV